MKVIEYNPTKTGAKFHKSNAFVRGIMGPVGSGKSVMCVMELLRRAMEQEPDADGVRRSRWVIVRNTYPELKATTIKTFSNWIPEEICPVVYNAPISAVLDIPHKGSRVNAEFLFISMDKVKDAKKVFSLDITGAWLNEVREIPKTIVDSVVGRAGRYPAKPTWCGIIMDTNPPDDLSWYYDLAEQHTPEGWAFFRQPGGLLKTETPDGPKYEPNPDAENIDHLPEKYYEKQANGAAEQYVDVMCCAEYKPMFDGKPVYKGHWNSKFHVATVDYVPGVPLVLGWDFGRTPACVIGQIIPSGQLRILDECYSDNSGVRAFAEGSVKPLLARRFPGCVCESYGDPAGAAKGQATEDSCISELSAVGIETFPTNTNDPGIRRESVIKALSRMCGGSPGMLVDPRCKMVIRGFDGGYCYSIVGKIMGGGEVKYAETPLKNMYSHTADALQYLCLGALGGGSGLRKKVEEKIVRNVMRQSMKPYNPLEF